MTGEVVYQHTFTFDELGEVSLKRERVSKTHYDTTCVGGILSLGAGVQSGTMVELLVEGDWPLHQLPVDAVLFADTGDEPFWVYDHVDYLRQRLEGSGLGIPLVTVQRENTKGIVGDALDPTQSRWAKMPLYTKENGKLRGRQRRQCTTEYKIEPIQSWQRDWLIEQGHGKYSSNGRRLIARGIHLNVYVGITMDEIQRVREERFVRWEHRRYPFIAWEWTRQDCIAYLLKKGLPVPRKSSCYICPYHRNDYWRMLQADHPDVFERACQFDDWLRTDDSQYYNRNMRADVFLHDSCVPLRDIDFSAELPMFELDSDGGVCGEHCFI